MSRYVDADLLIEKKWQAESEACFYALEDVVSVTGIEESPSIDIVRCKECKHNWDGECTETNHLVNGMVAFDVLPDDYCSYGEREGE